MTQKNDLPGREDLEAGHRTRQTPAEQVAVILTKVQLQDTINCVEAHKDTDYPGVDALAKHLRSFLDYFPHEPQE